MSPGLAQTGPLATELVAAQAALLKREAQVLADHQAGRNGTVTACRLAEAMDEFLIAVYHEAVPRASDPPRLALVALGGQGRKERCPKSDIDLLLLHDGSKAAVYGRPRAIAQLSDRLFYPLWNAKLELGHGTRTVSETLALCENDEPALTSHLDARLLAGDAALFAELQAGLKGTFRRLGPGYLARVLEPVRQMARAESLVFVLEPNVKTGAGGLRDLHQISWIGRFRFSTGDFSQLLLKGALSPSEHRQLLAARGFYLRLRTELHLYAGRKQDQLTFEAHRELARRLGFARAADSAGLASVEQLLSRHYNHARHVIDIKHRFLLRVAEAMEPKRWLTRPKRLADGFVQQRGQLSAASEQTFIDEPSRLLSLFVSSLRHGLPIADGTFDVLSHSLSLIDDRFRSSAEHAALFWTIIDHPHADQALMAMHHSGILGRFFPEFGRIKGQVQADFYHTYTVDVHTLHLLELLYALRRGEGENEFARLVEVEPSFRSLVMGCFFHDAGKASGRDHAVYGAELVEQVMIRLGAPLLDIEDAQFLVREHLLMPRISQRRDLSDDELIREFAATCGSGGRLNRLYVLAYVDTRSTGPTLWTPWKAALMKQLYERGQSALSADAVPTPPTPLWGLPARAQQVFSVDELQLLGAARDRGGDVFLGALTHSYRPLFVVTKDRPGLLATVAGVALESRLSIAAAELFSSEDGYAFDRFMVRYGGVDTDKAEPALQQAVKRLNEALRKNSVPVGGFTSPPFRAPFLLPAVKVTVGPATMSGRVIDVFAPDRAGLLFDLSRVIYQAGYSITVAKVSTEGARAIDAFYLRAARPDVLPLEELKTRLGAAAEPPG